MFEYFLLPLRFISGMGSLLELGGGNLETLLRSLEVLLDQLNASVEGSHIGFSLLLLLFMRAVGIKNGQLAN